MRNCGSYHTCETKTVRVNPHVTAAGHSDNKGTAEATIPPEAVATPCLSNTMTEASWACATERLHLLAMAPAVPPAQDHTCHVPLAPCQLALSNGPSSLGSEFTAPVESRAGAQERTQTHASWWRRLRAAAGSAPVRAATAWAMCFNFSIAVGSQAPGAFDDHGYELYSLCLPTLPHLKVGVLALGVGSGRRRTPLLTCLHQVSCRRRAVTAKSHAAGDPARAGRYRRRQGAGRYCWCRAGDWGNNRPGLSRSGPRPPRSAQAHTRSRKGWWRWVLCPPATHMPAWCVGMSKMPLHRGHQLRNALAPTSCRLEGGFAKDAGPP